MERDIHRRLWCQKAERPISLRQSLCKAGCSAWCSWRNDRVELPGCCFSPASAMRHPARRGLGGRDYGRSPECSHGAPVTSREATLTACTPRQRKREHAVQEPRQGCWDQKVGDHGDDVIRGEIACERVAKVIARSQDHED